MRSPAIPRPTLPWFRQTWTPLLGIDEDLGSRLSDQFWSDFYVVSVVNGTPPQAVFCEVLALEGRTVSHMQKAAPLKHALAGLWHKHFRPSGLASYIVNMASDRRERDHMARLIHEATSTAGGKGETELDGIATKFSSRLAGEPITRRAQRSGLTGDWIIYAPHRRGNHYLCLATHDEAEQSVEAILGRVGVQGPVPVCH